MLQSIAENVPYEEFELSTEILPKTTKLRTSSFTISMSYDYHTLQEQLNPCISVYKVPPDA